MAMTTTMETPPEYLSAMWNAIIPALGDHLWQSTLFAVVAGLLTLLLRKHHARARYWLWLAASVKFLLPFSLLVGIGNHLAWSRGSAGAAAGLYFAMEEISQPFTQVAAPVISQAAPSLVHPLAHPTIANGTMAYASLLHLLPVLAAVWLCGFSVVLFVWYVRWAQIFTAVREAATLYEGREVDALRRLERLAGMRKGIEMLRSRTTLEPGIFGIARPVLLWPEGISEHLSNAQLDAILAHELRHVRRQDNLTAAIHMVVEAAFWFHPLVWWLGARLVAEREHACDEEVLALGTERHVYAESILNVCKFCLGSPLACVSGVTGADLKKRMVHIMTDSVSRKLDFTRKLLLSAAGLLAIALPILFGLANPTPSRAQSQAEETSASVPAFSVASVKPDKSGNGQTRFMFAPDGLQGTNVPLRELLREAYGVQDKQISGAPDWLSSERYDVEGKLEKPATEELSHMDENQAASLRQHMLQALLAEQFKLAVHRETKEIPVYILVVAENGPKFQESKFQESKSDDVGPGGPKGQRMMRISRDGQLASQGTPMSLLVRLLSEQVGRPVLDKTGLTGNYDFALQWKPDPSLVNPTPMFKGEDGQLKSGQQEDTGTSSTESSKPSIFTAIQGQLGLKLEPQKAPIETLVIDHSEPPAEN
jgi:bla regulator protein BlaR1